jgi:hypothetical protein
MARMWKVWRSGTKRRAALAVAVLVGLALAAVGQSAAQDAATSPTPSSSGEALAPLGQIPQDFAASVSQDSPGVEITAGPSATVPSSDATFAFQSSSDSASFECSLDGSAYEPCTSPKSYSGLDNGAHVFSVEPSDGSSAAAQRGWTVKNLMPCTGADEPANFPVYSLGRSVAGLDLTSVSRRCDPLQPGAATRANFVSYVYGTCDAADGEAVCAPPLELQTWPACERSLSDYEIAAGVPYPHEKLGQLDGVPAYAFDQGTRVELYTGEATIVIFASDPVLIDQAVAAIQPEPADQPPGEPAMTDVPASSLPDPAPGAIAGDLSCA